jgi:cytochrome P450
MSKFADVRFGTAEYKADPFALYAYLRAEEPVRRVVLPSRQVTWLVSRYDDVSLLLRDPRFVKEPRNAMTPEQMKRQQRIPKIFAPLMANMLDRDDPDHARLRRLVQKAFTPQRVEAMRASVQTLSDGLIDRILVKGGTFDLIGEYALPLPVEVISELLGIPVKDRGRFAKWSNALVQNMMTPLAVLMAMPRILAFMRYLRWLIELKRDMPADDLVSALVQAEDEGQQLDADELLAMIAILLTAGHETTTHLIGNGVLELLRRPDELARLRSDAGVMGSAVEELLRFATPVEISTNRYAREDVELAGVTIPRGATVQGIIASANRDERQFARAEEMDLVRSPNRHLTFGQGGHYCVGAVLARMEGDIAIGTLVRRLPELRLAETGKPLRWRRGLLVRGLEALPVRVS